jgi:hypothetical protein
MEENRVSAEISELMMQALATFFKGIDDTLPFLIVLSKEEKQALAKMGDASESFVRKACDLALLDDKFLPRSFDALEFKKDIKLYNDLSIVEGRVLQLLEKIKDTKIRAGNEAYLQALEVYRQAKLHRKTEAVEILTASMKKRFQQKPKDKPGEITPESETK